MTADMRKSLRSIAMTALGVALAGLVVGAVACVVPFEVRRHTNVTENSNVEHTQLAVLGLASLAFAIRAATRRETPRAMALCSLTIAAMAVRELDGALDVALWHGSWFLIDLFIAAVAIALVCRSPKNTLSQTCDFIASRRFPLFAAGIVAAVVFSQILGWKGIWNAIFDVPVWRDAVTDPAMFTPDHKLLAQFDIPRHVKNTVEEGFELGSYLMLLFSALLPSQGRSRVGESK